MWNNVAPIAADQKVYVTYSGLVMIWMMLRATE